MDTKVVTPIDKKNIKVAAERLCQGALVVFPTETVYGLGAHPESLEAVKAIYGLKGRAFSKPLGLHISRISLASVYANGTDSEVFQKLATSFWPGPLTIVLPKKDTVSDTITAGMKTIALRFPSHPIGLQFIEAAGGAVVGTSANVSGGFSATSVKDVRQDLDGKIEYIISGDAGMLGVESTVLEIFFDKNGEPSLKLLRKGAIGERMINRTLGYEALISSSGEHTLLKQSVEASEEQRMEGKKIVFYSFDDLSKVVEDVVSKNDVAAVIFKEQMYCEVFPLLKNPVLKKRIRIVPKMKFFVKFYKILRAFDADSLRAIYIPRLEGSGIEESIMSLLSKY